MVYATPSVGVYVKDNFLCVKLNATKEISLLEALRMDLSYFRRNIFGRFELATKRMRLLLPARQCILSRIAKLHARTLCQNCRFLKTARRNASLRSSIIIMEGNSRIGCDFVCDTSHD